VAVVKDILSLALVGDDVRNLKLYFLSSGAGDKKDSTSILMTA